MLDKLENTLDFVKRHQGHTRTQWLMVIIASSTLLSYGLEVGWVSPMTKILQSDRSPTGYAMSDTEITWVGSIMAFVAVPGVSLYAWVADRYGRKVAVLALAVPQLLAWIIKLSATNLSMLILSRVVAGLPSGGCFNVLPMYIREICQDNIRGAAVSFCLMMQCIGIFAMYAMGSYLDYYTVIWIATCIPLTGVAAMVFAPESPAFLVKREKIEDASKTLALLRGLDIDDIIIQNELNSMRKEELQFKSIPKLSFGDILKNRIWRRGFIACMLIVTAQACNGTYAIVMYAWTILSSMGVALNPDLQTLVVPTLMIVGSLISIVSVEKFGRKLLGVVTYIVSALGLTMVGGGLVAAAYGTSLPAWLPLLAVAAIVSAYSAGVTPAVYVVIAEIFTFQVRAKLVGCIVSYAWFVSSLQVFAFIPISNCLGLHNMFFIFAGINVFGAIATLTLLPETKGKSIEEIEELLRK
ncbi:hypothetical protein ACJJTC_000746 [Scirpophaga incertulas]